MVKWLACGKVLAEEDLAVDRKKAGRLLVPEADPCQGSCSLAPAKVSNNEEEHVPDPSIAGRQNRWHKKYPLKLQNSALQIRFKGRGPDQGLEVDSLRASFLKSNQ